MNERSDEDRQLEIWLGLVRLGEHFGEDGEKAAQELLYGKSALARLARKMLDLKAPPVNRGGRPPDDHANRMLWAYVRAELARGRKITPALEDWAGRAEEESIADDRAKEFEALRKRWGRIKDFWDASDMPQSLADLFRPVPPKRNKLTKHHKGTKPKT